MRIAAICTENSAPGYHRILWPLLAMEGGHDVYITNYLKEEDVSNADVIIFNRHPSHNRIDDIIEWRKKYGFKIIVDIDDYWHLGEAHILKPMWDEYNTTSTILYCITHADYIIVSTAQLYKHVIEISKNCTVIHNAINYGEGQFLNIKGNGDYTKLFWAGGITHDKDIEILRNPLKRVQSAFGNDVCMVMGGYQKETIVWDRMLNAFTCGNKLQRIILNMMPIEKYYNAYQLCDISIVPLIDNEFNSCKSNLKILEAAGVDAPVIVSNVGPYRGFPIALVNYVNTQQDWYTHISYLLRNKSKITEQGKALAEYCKTYYNFKELNEKRRQIIEHVAGK